MIFFTIVFASPILCIIIISYSPCRVNSQKNGKFHQLPSGELLIHNLDFGDQFPTYRCRTMHRLSRQVVISSAANVNVAGK
ncbi:hypothetical protein YQE_07622, partial [Dendroctonus ponderosae]